MKSTCRRPEQANGTASNAILTPLLLSLLAGGAAAKTQVPRMIIAQIDDGTAHHRSEMALRVSKTTLDVMAAWHQHPSHPHSNVHYNVSTDGRTFGDADLVPLPEG